MQHSEKPTPHGDEGGESAVGRRGFLRLAGLSGAAPLLAWSDSLHAAPAPKAKRSTDPSPVPGSRAQGSVYERMFGVRPVINAAGPVTALGGTTLSKEVTDAMAAASREFVDLNALYNAAGARLAEITKSQAAMVTSGAFAAMTLGAAACLAGDDADKIAALPHPTWRRRETLIQRAHSTPYERAYRDAGMTLVYVDTEDELRAAISDRTAMIAGLINAERMNLPGAIPLARLVSIGKSAGVPIYFDASFSVTHNSPPSSLWRYTQLGADIVGISGGKGLHGPQSTGILAGRADLIASARKQATPSPSALGRGMKVDKEEVVGLMAAVEQFLRRDADALHRRDRARVDTMKRRVSDIPGVRLGYEDAYFGPGLILMWDQADIPLTYGDFVGKMKEGERPIEMLVASGPTAYFGDVNGPALYAGYLNDGEDVIVANRAREILLAARRS
jgi:L-seryl-tRNA(Ser) seleniumtransferase